MYDINQLEERLTVVRDAVECHSLPGQIHNDILTAENKMKLLRGFKHLPSTSPLWQILYKAAERKVRVCETFLRVRLA